MNTTRFQRHHCRWLRMMYLAGEYAMSICVPSGFDWRPRTIFGKATGMKSQKQVATNGVLKFCLCDMLCQSQCSPCLSYWMWLQICVQKLTAGTLVIWRQEYVRHWSSPHGVRLLSMQVIVFHLLHHLPMFSSFWPSLRILDVSIWMIQLVDCAKSEK